MRGEYSRYKIFQKGLNLNFVPIRILNLKRPKWDLSKLKIKRVKVLKNGQRLSFNFFKSFNTKKLLGFLKRGTRSTLPLKPVFVVSKNAKKIKKLRIG